MCMCLSTRPCLKNQQFQMKRRPSSKTTRSKNLKNLRFCKLISYLCPTCFNKNEYKFITSSYDRTCKVWDTITGKELLSLEGHKNVVYTMAFNKPFGDKIVADSFDRTAKLWDSNSGDCLYTLVGHTMEIVYLVFDPNGWSMKYYEYLDYIV
ncbi:unnamed protein product [Moneuplotes crassus]|uniref:Uncharacterized protein n=1 Tax=Euplotes crassus TaxID=5936 RepID=A0AAD1UJU9_EUPCR|nr:unnamed protein product [Moneuplotes crassus]